jgi:PAS domain-containing protein
MEYHMLKIPAPPRMFLRFLVATLIVVLATAVRMVCMPSLGLRAPFLTFYPAVFIAATSCGLPGGILSTILSLILARYFWMEPPGQVWIPSPNDQVIAAVFIISGIAFSLVISYGAKRLRRAKLAEVQAQMAEEQQRADEKVRESELRLRLALEGGQMGMWEWRVGSNEAQWDNMKFELHGLPLGEGHVSTGVALRTVHPDDAPAYKLALEDAITQERTFFQEFRVIRPDGEVRWLAEKGRLFKALRRIEWVAVPARCMMARPSFHPEVSPCNESRRSFWCSARHRSPLESDLC